MTSSIAACRAPPRHRRWAFVRNSGWPEALDSLPPAVQVRLSGRPAVQLDGETLAPKCSWPWRCSSAGVSRRPRRSRRRRPGSRRRRLSAVYAGKPTAVGAVTRPRARRRGFRSARVTMRRPSREGRTRCSSTTTAAGSPSATSTRTTASAASFAATPARTSSPSTTAWRPSTRSRPRSRMRARRCAGRSRTPAELGADPARIGVGGDSAGGNLAAVVAQLAARDGGPAPVLQLLIYPATDFSGRRRSRELFGEGFLLTNAEMDWFETNYLGPRAHAERSAGVAAAGRGPLGARSRARRHRRFDPLRDEGEAYAEALQAAGTPALSVASPASPTPSSQPPASAATAAMRSSRSPARRARCSATALRPRTAEPPGRGPWPPRPRGSWPAPSSQALSADAMRHA